MYILHLLNLGYKRQQSAKIVGCHPNSATNYVKLYNSGGLDAVRQSGYNYNRHELSGVYGQVDETRAQAECATVDDAPIPEHFPVEEQVIEPEGDTEGLAKIGEERTEWVEYTPASLVKKVIIRPKYAVPEEEGGTTVLAGQLPSRPVPKSIAGASLLAHIIVAKFIEHLPFYRQGKRFARDYG